MRGISHSVKERLNSRLQAGANKVQSSLWVGRPSVPLTDPIFLQKQLVNSSGITKASIAVSHTKMMRDTNDIYIAYIQDGIVNIKTSKYYHRMELHEWTLLEFAKPASDVSICFDGTMPKVPSGQIEFITEDEPWIFWIDENQLFCQKLNDESSIVLAKGNCQAVSSVKAPWSDVSEFNFGLVVFFILDGNIYYRQYINNEWKDAELVRMGPSDVTWVDISAFRTWDYRIGIQALAQDGKIYELFTQYMGLGSRNQEHIEVRQIDVSGKTTKISFDNYQGQEHIDVNGIDVGALYGGLYSIHEPKIISVFNIDDGEGDWGKIIKVKFDVHLERNSVLENHSNFKIVDELNATYSASFAIVEEDGKTVTLSFADLNAARGLCTLSYSPGTAITMAGTSMVYAEFDFIPENLNPPDVDAPEPIDLWNGNEDGTIISIRFSEHITSGVDESLEAFNITMPTYDMVPEGTIIEESRSVINTMSYISVDKNIDITNGELNNVQISGGGIKLEVDEGG